jgi:hypothetical protein
MSKREVIEPTKGDKRYARRDQQGQFSEQTDVGRAAAADQRQHSKTPAKRGQGDRGDRQAKH